MMNFNMNKVILCSVFGLMTLITSVNCDFDSLEYKDEITANAGAALSASENDGWGLIGGRYNDSKSKAMTSSSETTVQTGILTSEYENTSDMTYISSDTEISETVTTPPVTSVTETETVSSKITGESVVTSITSVTAVSPENTSLDSEQILSNPVPEGIAQDNSYFDKCVFVGDSIMEGISAYQFLPESQVFASVGLNPYQLNTNTISTYYGTVTAFSAVLSAKPENLYIMMGMNGVAWDINDDMIEQISIFIDNIKTSLPSVNIYIMSVTPVSAEREAKPSVADGKILNSQIDSFNNSLLSLANEKGVYYLDINDYLKGDNGCLPSELSSDGIHISKTVYEDILEYILCHIVE